MVIEKNNKGFNRFFGTCKETLGIYAPLKKYLRGNHYLFMNKVLSQEIVKRTRLRNKFLKHNVITENYIKHRNFCVFLLRKTKKDYYGNLNPEKIMCNGTFWRTVKSFLSKKSIANEKKLVGKFLASDMFVAKVLRKFFSNIKALGIPEFVQNDLLTEKVNPLVPGVH